MNLDLVAVERELCRIPDVRAARVVAGPDGQPVEIHVLAAPGKAAKQIVRDVQSVTVATFGVEIDHRIVSVVQLDEPGPPPAPSSAATPPEPLSPPADDPTPERRPEEVHVASATAEATRPAADDERVPSTAIESITAPRTMVERVVASRSDTDYECEVTLRLADERVTGRAEGSVASTASHRLVAEATLAALAELGQVDRAVHIETATIFEVVGRPIAFVTVVVVHRPYEELLSGSAPVRGSGEHEALVRAVLDATNRRVAGTS